MARAFAWEAVAGEGPPSSVAVPAAVVVAPSSVSASSVALAVASAAAAAGAVARSAGPSAAGPAPCGAAGEGEAAAAPPRPAGALSRRARGRTCSPMLSPGSRDRRRLPRRSLRMTSGTGCRSSAERGSSPCMSRTCRRPSARSTQAARCERPRGAPGYPPPASSGSLRAAPTAVGGVAGSMPRSGQRRRDDPRSPWGPSLSLL